MVGYGKTRYGLPPNWILPFQTRRFSTAVKFDQAVKTILKPSISVKTTVSGRIWANPIWVTTKLDIAFPTTRFSTAVKFDRAVKPTWKIWTYVKNIENELKPPLSVGYGRIRYDLPLNRLRPFKPDDFRPRSNSTRR